MQRTMFMKRVASLTVWCYKQFCGYYQSLLCYKQPSFVSENEADESGENEPKQFCLENQNNLLKDAKTPHKP